MISKKSQEITLRVLSGTSYAQIAKEHKRTIEAIRITVGKVLFITAHHIYKKMQPNCNFPRPVRLEEIEKYKTELVQRVSNAKVGLI